MQEMVEFIVKKLVDKPEEVVISTVKEEDATVIKVKVSQEELGRVVGGAGRNAQAIRTLVHSLAGKQGFSEGKLLVKFE